MNIDFKYADNYKELHHTEHDKRAREKGKMTAPVYPFRDGRQLDDLAEGTFLMSSNTKKIHNDFDMLQVKTNY